MNKVKHILAIIIVLGIFSALAYFLPRTPLGETLMNRSAKPADVPEDSVSVQDTVPFIDRMKEALEVVQSSYSKRKKRDIWTLGKGRTITLYLLQAQRFLQKNGGRVLYMEELYDNPSVFQSAKLDALTPAGDTLNLTFNVSENVFRDNASYLAIAFQVQQLTPELIVALNALDFPYDLLVTPFGMAEGFLADLHRIKNKEVVLWLLMESTSLDSRHNRMRPIRIHHTEQQIESIISDATNAVPEAKGIATRFGENAVEHRQLLQATLAPAKENGLWFADLSLNPKSRILETCSEVAATCKILAPYNPSNSAIDDYVKQKMRSAARNGMAAMILPLTEKNIQIVKPMKTKAQNQGTTLINLSTFMKY